ncbi:LamG-like jellyroll fold domain-containing protein [Mesorhizobium sp. BAC0120]|uniref:LamG-like jellyroll fold domain-containing protein n=1 Tax=Mesorhizobium sp. BAC0120 TaxID=3090670 RepID=UPI00298C4286|nr:LamG-like jellyroll fold domain-containing protein [Mesorhizobium sp. BAC0120]MDW6021592.1 LamG-like jellyroll fold domain-containing protein [Mesorhizobium sp. BAC0120]
MRESGRKRRVSLTRPAVLLILAATAVPVEMRPPGYATLDFTLYPADFVENLAGYAPLGLVLAASGPLRAVVAAALISAIAEVSQFVMMHRDPSVIDILANTIGAAFGAGISTRFKVGPLELSLNRWTGLAAAFAACAIVLWAFIPSVAPVNPRGFTSPGMLEAHWKLDEPGGPTAEDSSGHYLNGRFQNLPKRVPGVLNGAVAFDGVTDSIDFEPSTALRIAGSMTITAWINSSVFPKDDAAVVSQLSGSAGYQLDTTVDEGPRTIGFKLTNAYGQLMARYGATPLGLKTWHHIAGVYDAPAQTLDVYLDGELDNGFLVGPVTSRQRSSRAGVSIGRRRDMESFEFAGAIDDVRIYSLALTKAQIRRVMHGDSVDDLTQRDTHPQMAERIRMSDDEDTRVPLSAVALGMLTAIAILGLRPSSGRAVCLLASLLAALLFLFPVSGYLPLFNLWLIPLLCLAGSASVALAPQSRLADSGF